MWRDFFRSWEPTWLQNGGKLGIENAFLPSLTENREIPKSAYFSNRISIILGFGWSKIEAKIHQKSKKQRPQHGKASWHRFFNDFDGFWWISGGNLGRKIEPRSIKKGNEKTMTIPGAARSLWKPPEGRGPGQGERRLRLVPRALGSIYIIDNRYIKRIYL